MHVTAWRGVLLAAAMIAAALPACRRASADDVGTAATASPSAAGGAGSAAKEEPVTPKVLAEVVNQAAALTVQVIDAQRVTPDTVRIEIALINTSRAPEPLDVVRVLTGRDGATFTPADLCLLTTEGSRRLFVLRDAAGKPLTGGGFEPLQPGERRQVWAMFPSPGPAAEPAIPRVNVVLGGMVLRDVPISPARAGTVRLRTTSMPG